MALFWHGHLTSSTEGPLARLVFRQIRTWRAKGLGDVHALMQAMAIDPAMLDYLDNDQNVAGRPNENFAREVMELFTMGNGTFAWDGIATDGQPQPDGLYTINIEGTNISGKPVKVTSSSIGIVSAVDFSSGTPMVTVGAAKVPLSDISEVRLPEVKAPTT
jgi:hypothetical protein